ncbi:hypothetical protein [Nocardia rhamnosiphila]|uniref:hypothetical protein n=1 Tax=Nocardia rhamnosiphila TaxID=426716 RepID=UPI0004C38BC3|nr:hypothetical protein [Nocardia rhamnosiphila]
MPPDVHIADCFVQPGHMIDIRIELSGDGQESGEKTAKDGARRVALSGGEHDTLANADPGGVPNGGRPAIGPIVLPGSSAAMPHSTRATRRKK